MTNKHILVKWCVCVYCNCICMFGMVKFFYLLWYDSVFNKRVLWLFCYSRRLDTLFCLYTASDGYVKLKKGERFTVDCKAKVRGQESFSLYARYPSKHVLVVYDEKTNKHTLGNEYKGRINISGTIDHLKIVINALQLNDSGLYLGHYNKYNIEKNEEEIEEGCAVLLFVKGKNLYVSRIYILGNIDFTDFTIESILFFCFPLFSFTQRFFFSCAVSSNRNYLNLVSKVKIAHKYK